MTETTLPPGKVRAQIAAHAWEAAQQASFIADNAHLFEKRVRGNGNGSYYVGFFEPRLALGLAGALDGLSLVSSRKVSVSLRNAALRIEADCAVLGVHR